MLRSDQPESMKALLGRRLTVKPPAHPWQDLALAVINELGIPAKKRSAVFLVCKRYPKQLIEKALNETKELAKTGERWRYFFKVIESKHPLFDKIKNVK